MPTKTKLTIRKIEALNPGDETIWDTDVQGLHIRALKTGKYFYLFYRNKYGEQRRPSLGRYGSMTLQQARDKARDWWHLINNGGDPAHAKKMERENDNPTVLDLKNRWETDHAPKLKSKKDMLSAWNRYIIPVLGKKKVRDITKKDIMRTLAGTRTNYTYNRVRSLLLKSFNLAEDWDWREEFTNPCRKITKKPEEQRRRYMRPDEVRNLGKKLKKWDDSLSRCEVVFAGLVRLLMFTGARRNEIMTAKWDYVDWHRGILDLPDSKTGAKEIVLPTEAIFILKRLKTKQVNDWIIPGRYGKAHLVSPKKMWKRLCEEAGIKNLRMHDLRHTFASTAMSAAQGTLPQVGALLGHRQADTTKRYAHFMTDPKRELANRTSSTLNAWMKGEIKE